MGLALTLVLCLFTIFRFACSRDINFGTPLWSDQPDVCKPGPKGRVPWIIHKRDSDYGWGEHTHRANIALAVNDYPGDEQEMQKMALQLEVELTRDLFRSAPRIHDSDLALYIHALLATKKNPRNFHGLDLVAELLKRVESTNGIVNPFLLLALCNSHVIEHKHLERLKEVAHAPHSDIDSRKAQFKALAFKTYACAAEIDNGFDHYAAEKEAIRDCLHRKYNKEDGSFGNVYTTSLAVQAFTAAGENPDWWSKKKSIEYLERESETDLNLIKAYYIEMGLNAENVRFVKNLYDGVPVPGLRTPKLDAKNYVQYTVKREREPDDFLSLTLDVKPGTNFYEIMKKASHISDVFKFAAYQNSNGDPVVYSVSGIPNDVEENLFWRICRHYSVDHNRRTATVEAFDESPSRLAPLPKEHVIYLYSNGGCS